MKRKYKVIVIWYTEGKLHHIKHRKVVFETYDPNEARAYIENNIPRGVKCVIE